MPIGLGAGLGVGGGRSATSSGAPTGGGAAPFENALSAHFDGSDDYLQIGSSGDMGSFSLWFKTDSTITTGTTGQYLISFTANSSAFGNLGLGSTTGQVAGPEILTFNQGNRAYAYSGSGLTINTDWHHVAGRWTGSTYEIYLDGTQVENQEGGAGTAGLVAFSALRIGGRAGAQNYAGLIDEVAVWASPLSAANIVTIYNSGTPESLSSYSPDGWWRMGDGTGDTDSGGGAPANTDVIGTVVDQGAGGNDATGTNGTTYSSTTP